MEPPISCVPPESPCPSFGPRRPGQRRGGGSPTRLLTRSLDALHPRHPRLRARPLKSALHRSAPRGKLPVAAVRVSPRPSSPVRHCPRTAAGGPCCKIQVPSKEEALQWQREACGRSAASTAPLPAAARQPGGGEPRAAAPVRLSVRFGEAA